MKKLRRYCRYFLEIIIRLYNNLKLNYYKKKFGVNYWEKSHSKNIVFDSPYSTTSQICNSEMFNMPFFYYWMKELKETCRYHRKLWEYAYICQTLHEHGLLKDSKKGVVFGCGKEPLIAYFASRGCTILATDLGFDFEQSHPWIDTNQHIKKDISELNERKICNDEIFYNNVSYRAVDMNHIPDDIKDYDFCWSTCSLEHIGSLEKGANFIKNSLNTLKSGGIAIHTTEFNLSSNINTYETEGISLFRLKDIEKIISDLEKEGHYVYPLIIDKGNKNVDKYIDFRPSGQTSVHLRLRVGGYTITSIGLIIKKK